MKTALVAGSTGLIGKQLLQLLLNSSRYDRVTAITRADLPIQHPKLTQLKIDFTKLEHYKKDLVGDDVFCCLGTTMAKARTKEKFIEADYTYPLELAMISSQNGARQFLLVSALGANKDASIFYNRVKGELDEAVTRVKFQAIHIFRPSLLLGPRTERRPGEDAAKVVYKIFGFLMPVKYKAIDSYKVAMAMLQFAAREERGIFIHDSGELQKL
jgi:uncharacterized protein YbjT (DUF2867 family)